MFRDIYNLTFKAANNVLMDFGYDLIEYRQDYFPHFSEDRSDSLIAKMLQKVGMDYNKNDLPTDIAGLTETFKPGKKFFANALQRQGSSTEYNALKGLDIYLEGVSDVIYHTEDIQKRRILEKELRIKFGKKGLKREIDEINRQWKNGIIDTAKKDVLINDAMEKGTSSQGALVTWIRDDTDTLAGKKSYIDRPPEKLMSRGMYDLSRQLGGRVAANMVGVNPASWLTNFIPLIQGGNVKYLNVK